MINATQASATLFLAMSHLQSSFASIVDILRSKRESRREGEKRMSEQTHGPGTLELIVCNADWMRMREGPIHLTR